MEDNIFVRGIETHWGGGRRLWEEGFDLVRGRACVLENRIVTVFG